MKVAVTGASGLIGSALVEQLRNRGDDVLRLVRRPTCAPDEVRWEPTSGDVDTDGLRGIDAAVHLAGAGVGDRRWTSAYKRTIRDSRVLGTRTLSGALASLDPLPTVLVSGSAIGIYGSDRGEEVLTERSAVGDGFLAVVVRDWESETAVAEAAGIRVVHARSGLVMSRKGGAFGTALPLFRVGLGGRLGDGRQWWSWISLRDEVRALMFLLDQDINGPVNLTSPEPVRNAVATAALGRALHRPTLAPVPAFALRLALGGFADDVLGSQRVLPGVLTDAGFTFEHRDVDSAARDLVG